MTLTLTNPNAFSTVVGTPFSDTIAGNSGNDTIIGAGGNDSLTAGSGGNAYIQGGITQVVYLDFTSSTPNGGWTYSPSDIAAITSNLQAIYSAFDFYFTSNLADRQARSQSNGSQFDTFTYNAGPAGGASNDIYWRRVNLSGTATVNAAALLDTPLRR